MNKRSEVQSLLTPKTDWCLSLIIKEERESDKEGETCRMKNKEKKLYIYSGGFGGGILNFEFGQLFQYFIMGFGRILNLDNCFYCLDNYLVMG